jgi:hypothetical protein
MEIWYCNISSGAVSISFVRLMVMFSARLLWTGVQEEKCIILTSWAIISGSRTCLYGVLDVSNSRPNDDNGNSPWTMHYYFDLQWLYLRSYCMTFADKLTAAAVTKLHAFKATEGLHPVLYERLWVNNPALLALLRCEFKTVFTCLASTLIAARFFFDLEACSLVTTALTSCRKLQLALQWTFDCI